MTGRAPTGQATQASPGAATASPPFGEYPSRGEHPLALMESLLGAADEVEGWGAGLEAAIMRASAAKLQQMYDALATIEDVWTLPASEHPWGDKWHCQHHENMYASSKLAGAAIATEARRAETQNSGSVHEGAGPKDIAQTDQSND